MFWHNTKHRVQSTLDKSSSLAIGQVESCPEERAFTASRFPKQSRIAFSVKFELATGRTYFCKVIDLLPLGSCWEGLPALFQADFPHINICQELTQS